MFRHLILSRKLADKVAASGFLVVVPDFYYGDPYDPDRPGFDGQSWLRAHPTVRFYFTLCQFRCTHVHIKITIIVFRLHHAPFMSSFLYLFGHLLDYVLLGERV